MSASTETSSAAEAEASVEHARAGLVGTLNQLRQNLQPANVAEEVMTNARVTASAVSEQVWDVARKNPIPALLIGAGAAMILGVGPRMVSSATRSRPVSRTGGSERAASRPSSNLGSERSTHIGLSPAPDALDRANQTARSLASRGGRALSTWKTTGTQSESAMSNYARTRDQISGSLSKLIDEQPLILAAFGIAVGAALGAAIPQTDAENSLMGEHAHHLRDATQDLVHGQVDQLKAAASHALDDIKRSASEHGVSADNISGLVRDVADTTKNATYEAGRTLDPTT